MTASRQYQGIDDAVGCAARGRDATLQLGVEEAEIEGGVVGNERGISDEAQETPRRRP